MTSDEAEKILSQVEPPDVVEGEHRRPLKERLLEAHAEIVAKGVGAEARPVRSVFRLAVACAAAACVVAGWVVWSASRGANVAPNVNTMVSHPVTSPAQPDGLAPGNNSASFLTYHRALNEPPQALNSLLDQEAKSSAGPMRSLTDMDASRFLQTLDPVKENGHETRNMDGHAHSALV